MKKEALKALRITVIFIASGLAVSFFVFFILFGKGLQIFLPVILFAVFFTAFLLLEKIPLISKKPILKAILAIALIAVWAALV